MAQRDELNYIDFNGRHVRTRFEKFKQDFNHDRICPEEMDALVWFAAVHGHLEIVQWAHSVGAKWKANTCADAAAHGHLHLLRWVREHGCPWDIHACEYAIAHNRWTVLQWLVDNGAPCPEWIFEAAIRLGHPLKRPAVVKGE